MKTYRWACIEGGEVLKTEPTKNKILRWRAQGVKEDTDYKMWGWTKRDVYANLEIRKVKPGVVGIYD